VAQLHLQVRAVQLGLSSACKPGCYCAPGPDACPKVAHYATNGVITASSWGVLCCMLCQEGQERTPVPPARQRARPFSPIPCRRHNNASLHGGAVFAYRLVQMPTVLAVSHACGVCLTLGGGGPIHSPEKFGRGNWEGAPEQCVPGSSMPASSN
jgi:hypothetical protein